MSDEAAAAEMVAEGSPTTPEVEAQTPSPEEALRAELRAEIEAEIKAEAVAEAEALAVLNAPAPPDYEWPTPTPEQLKRFVPGGQAATRVVKITYKDPEKRFNYDNGRKTVHIGQYRVPRADKQWDVDRLFLELRRNQLMLLEEAFPEAPHYCETNDCWAPAKDGAFCSPSHRDAVLNAHERIIRFE